MRPDLTPDNRGGLWAALHALTAARIGLGRAGASLTTTPQLEFRLAHARARDAVHASLDTSRLLHDLGPFVRHAVVVHSAAQDRQTYLMRPDLGRQLAPGEAARLAAQADNHDIVFVIADGLSANAAQRHAVPLLELILPPLQEHGWRVAPVVVALAGRVALGDAIATAMRVSSVAVLIGERPGLSAPDSLGVYLTWHPAAGTTDADRNCLSNIRPAGVSYAEAARKALLLLHSMRERGHSGVALKDESDRPEALAAEHSAT